MTSRETRYDAGAGRRADGGTAGGADALIAELSDRVRFVERQLEAERQAHAEARRIIGGLVQRIPELEAPTTAPERPPQGPETVATGDLTRSRRSPQSGSLGGGEGVRGLKGRGSWTFLYPLGELCLTPAVGREFRVDRVTFVHKDWLPLVRKNFGLRATVSEIKKQLPARRFFEDAQTSAFAVVQQEGEREEVEQECLKLVREELTILASSQLGYKTRKQMEPIASPGEISRSYMTFLAIDNRSTRWFQNMGRSTRPYSQVVMSWSWKKYQDLMFFTSLLKILRKETKVDKGWRNELRRAAVLIGESVGANDSFKSFLWNMVTLEMLLIKYEERNTRGLLPRRIGALLDWVPDWWSRDYVRLIKGAYDKRNHLLHQGRRDELTEWDLAFTDHLLLHVLANLVKYPKHFPFPI